MRKSHVKEDGFGRAFSVDHDWSIVLLRGKLSAACKVAHGTVVLELFFYCGRVFTSDRTRSVN